MRYLPETYGKCLKQDESSLDPPTQRKHLSTLGVISRGKSGRKMDQVKEAALVKAIGRAIDSAYEGS